MFNILFNGAQPDYPAWTFNHRAAKVQELVDSVAQSASPGLSQITVGYTLKDSDSPAYAQRNNIYFQPLLFCSFDELPVNLRPSGPADPRLDDRRYLQQIADLFYQRLGLPSSPITMEEILCLRTSLRLLEDLQKAKDACSFLLFHEIGHIHHQHSQKTNIFNAVAQKVAFVVTLLLTITTAAALGLAIGPLFALAALAVPVLGYLVYNIAITAYCRHHEFQADRFAATHSPSAHTGVQYGTGSVEKALDDLKKSSALTIGERIGLTLVTLAGEPITTCLTHGSHATRVARCLQGASFSWIKAL